MFKSHIRGTKLILPISMEGHLVAFYTISVLHIHGSGGRSLLGPILYWMLTIASIYGVSATVQIQIRLAPNQVLHCLLIEFIIIIQMKLLLTIQQPLKSKWIRLIDKLSSFHYSIILSDGQVIYLISRFLLV